MAEVISTYIPPSFYEVSIVVVVHDGIWLKSMKERMGNV